MEARLTVRDEAAVGAELLACPECDLLQRAVALPPGAAALCRRCGATLYRDRPDSLDRTLAYTLAAAIMFIVANAFPIVVLDMQGHRSSTTLVGAAMALHPQMTSVALLILATTVLLPTVQILAMLTLLLPLRFGRVPPGLRELSRVMVHVRPWAMVEVFLLGALVSLAKLSHLAHLEPGVALFAFGALIVLLALAASSFDERLLWQASGRGPREPAAVNAAPTTAAEAGLMRCHACGLLQAATGHDGHAHCERCGAPLHVRKPDGLSRTWALLIAACILYVPANVLPVMVTRSVVGTQSDTIMSGVIYLWTTGSWPLAALIFFASVMVPLLKIIALALLTFTAQRRSTWALQERTKLFRVVEFVGRWSMIDIFVVGVLAALVQFGALATIGPGPGAIAFGAVVVLTMLAAEAFDPRSLWDPVRGRESER